MEKSVANSTIKLVKGDITEQQTDAIVNAANEHLAHGGGVAGAIVRKGGRTIQEESNEWIKAHGSVKTGYAVITAAGSLKAKYVIHAVGPIMGSGNEDEKLRLATLNSLKLADQYGIRSIAFPAISTGIFGYPIERCADIMLATTEDYLQQSDIETVIFCLYDQKSYKVFQMAFEE